MSFRVGWEDAVIYGKGGGKREKMRTRLGRRTVRYEKKLEKGEGGE